MIAGNLGSRRGMKGEMPSRCERKRQDSKRGEMREARGKTAQRRSKGGEGGAPLGAWHRASKQMKGKGEEEFHTAEKKEAFSEWARGKKESASRPA